MEKGSIKLADRVDMFIEKINNLSEKDIIFLRRNFNKAFEVSDVNSKITFYKINVSDYQEEIWYFCACLLAYYKYKNQKYFIPIQDIIGAEYKKDSNTTLTKKFMDIAQIEKVDNIFIYKLGQLIKQLESKGYAVDVKELLLDMLIWEKPFVLKKWVGKVYNV